MTKSPPSFLAPPEEISYERASVVILPCPLEKTTSYMKGTFAGPQAILEASAQVEFYDVELKEEPWRVGINTLKALDFSSLDSREAVGLIEKSVGKILDDKKFPICLGGEHTLSAGPVAACAKRHPNLSILQIDAHADLREAYEGSPFSHASAMRLCLKQAKKLVGVGIRSIALEEVQFVERHPEVTLIYDHERREMKDWVKKALDGLTDVVYLTIDVDGFSPALIPATGTPEPGGLSWYEGLDLISALFQKKRVVGADIVELLPLPGLHASSFTAAKLVYKLIGYFKRFQKNKS